MTSLSDPPCLIEHEFYVENAVWIRIPHGNVHLMSVSDSGGGGGGGGTLIFSYKRRLGHFWGAHNFEF